MASTRKFWKNRKVLVTGAGGFVGSHLTKALLNLGANVVAVVSERAVRRRVLPKNPKLKIKACDLADFASTQALFAGQSIDTVFHLASSPIVSQAALNPYPTVQNNVLAALNLLEACRLSKVKKILLASSDKAYGDHASDEPESLPYRESHALRGIDLYSASKVCADTLAQAYAYQYKMQIAVLRCCNIFGPGDVNFTRLIPRTIMLLLSKQAPVIKAGHSKVLREYLYIDDAVRAYIFLAEKLEKYYGRNFQHMPKKGRQTYGWLAFNVGSYSRSQTKNLPACPNIKNVEQIIALLSRKINPIRPVVLRRPPKFIEIPDEYLDSSKIRSLGFKTQATFERGIAASVNWYRQNFKNLKTQFLKQVSI